MDAKIIERADAAMIQQICGALKAMGYTDGSKLSLPFPSDREFLTIEVFYRKGDPAFVCGVHGAITGCMIEDIEKELVNNPFERGDGIYLYVTRLESPQVGDDGRIELSGYWKLEEVGFRPMKPNDGGEQT